MKDMNEVHEEESTYRMIKNGSDVYFYTGFQGSA
jgi:hypothetical protein